MKKLILLLLLVPIISFSQEKEYLSYDSVERPPIYPGCDMNIKNKLLRSCFVKKIQNHIARNFRYPEFAQKTGIQGRVFVQFIIDKDGALRGRDDNENVGYDARSVADVHNNMVDDVKVILAEYRLALKKYNADRKI